MQKDQYTCPMHPEIRQNHPGSCPKCGMALEAVRPLLAVSKTEFVCPMHPQIVRPEPGNCAICGMTLEPRVVSAAEEVSPELRLARIGVSNLPNLPTQYADPVREVHG